MNSLELLWMYYPLEVVAGGAITILCGLGISACIIWLFGDAMEDDEYVDGV